MKTSNFSLKAGYRPAVALIVGVVLLPAAAASVEGRNGAPAPSLGAERIYLAQEEQAPVDSPVSYSSEQADRGKEKYKRECAECHGDDLRGGLNGGPPLRGLVFEEKYFDGAPASDLFYFTSTAMPPQSPGRFSADIYADLVAYIIQQNGGQPGQPLPSDMDSLDYLIMEK